MSNDVGTPVPAYVEMAKRWNLIHALRGGTAEMRRQSREWLPKEEAESELSYQTRVNRSFLYGALNDTITKLKSKPFSKPIALSEGDDLPDMLKLIEDDADNARCSLTKFAADLFDDACEHGLTHVMVDYPPTGGQATKGEEERQSLHPYFVHVKAPTLIGWQSAIDAMGREVLTQVRIKEERVEPDGQFGQKSVCYVRVWTAETVQTWRESSDKTYVPVSEQAHSFGAIPIYTIYFKQTGFMTAEPPLEDLAWLNLEHWQSSSEQRNVLHVARVPILYEQGVQAGMGPDGKPRGNALIVSVGRARQTNVPPGQSDLKWVEHSGASITAGQEDLAKIEERMQILGMQPLVETSARTATEVGTAEARTHSSIKSWCSALNDGLWEAYWMAAKWIGAKLPEDFGVEVFSKFELEARSDSDMAILMQMRSAGDISRRRLLLEAKRRGKFGEDFDLESEMSEAEDGEMPTAPTPEEAARLAASRARGAAAPEPGSSEDEADDEDEAA